MVVTCTLVHKFDTPPMMAKQENEQGDFANIMAISMDEHVFYYNFLSNLHIFLGPTYVLLGLHLNVHVTKILPPSCPQKSITLYMAMIVIGFKETTLVQYDVNNDFGKS